MAVKSAKQPTKTTKKAAASGKTKFSKETYVKWYKDMLLIRRFEEKTGQLYIQQKFGGLFRRFYRHFIDYLNSNNKYRKNSNLSHHAFSMNLKCY